MFSVARFLVKTRQLTRRADSSDSTTLVGDVNDKVEKIPLPGSIFFVIGIRHGI